MKGRCSRDVEDRYSSRGDFLFFNFCHSAIYFTISARPAPVDDELGGKLSRSTGRYNRRA